MVYERCVVSLIEDLYDAPTLSCAPLVGAVEGAQAVTGKSLTVLRYAVGHNNTSR